MTKLSMFLALAALTLTGAVRADDVCDSGEALADARTAKAQLDQIMKSKKPSLLARKTWAELAVGGGSRVASCRIDQLKSEAGVGEMIRGVVLPSCGLWVNFESQKDTTAFAKWALKSKWTPNGTIRLKKGDSFQNVLICASPIETFHPGMPLPPGNPPVHVGLPLPPGGPQGLPIPQPNN